MVRQRNAAPVADQLSQLQLTFGMQLVEMEQETCILLLWQTHLHDQRLCLAEPRFTLADTSLNFLCALIVLLPRR